MNALRSLLRLMIALAAAAAFIGFSSQDLPPVVASHFSAGGAADGFMPRSAYLLLMVSTAVGAPLLLAALSYATRLFPVRFVNLPNREYWLAPERREATLAYLERHGLAFALLLAIFLCFVHWLVVLANRVAPPRFPESLLMAGLLLFVAALAFWIGTLFAHFARR